MDIHEWYGVCLQIDWIPPKPDSSKYHDMSNALLNIKRPLNKKTRDNSSVVETHPLVPKLYKQRSKRRQQIKGFFGENQKDFQEQNKI